MSYHWNWGIFLDPSPEGGGSYLGTLLDGLLWTINTAACAWAIALAVGTVVGVARTRPPGIASRLGTVFVELFRNIPLLVQLFLWFFVLPELLPSVAGTWLKQLPSAPFVTATVGLGLFTAARVAEQVRAGIAALPAGQFAAGTALGLRPAQIYRLVLLPVAMRIILPPLTSELLSCIKNTSVALTVGLLELTARTRAMSEFSFQVFEAFTAATLLYVALNLVVTLAMRALERRAALPGFGGRR